MFISSLSCMIKDGIARLALTFHIQFESFFFFYEECPSVAAVLNL